MMCPLIKTNKNEKRFEIRPKISSPAQKPLTPCEKSRDDDVARQSTALAEGQTSYFAKVI